MADKIARDTPGYFHWNKGAWFGGQIGCTAWLLPTGLILLVQRPFIGILWLSVFLAINGFGFSLWKRRDRLSIFLALQMLLFACGIGGLMALGALYFLAPDLPLPEITTRDGRLTIEGDRQHGIPQTAFVILLVIGAFMVGGALLEHGRDDCARSPRFTDRRGQTRRGSTHDRDKAPDPDPS